MGIVLIVPIFVIFVMLIVWGFQRKNLGKIRCNRCNHVGLAKGALKLGKGIVPVCAKCGKVF